MCVPVTTKNIQLLSSSLRFLSPREDEIVSASNVVIMVEGNHRIYDELLNHDEIPNLSLLTSLLKFGTFVFLVIK